MARKRPVEEIESFEVESLDAVDKPVSSANIHGMITSLSPVKKGRMRNYFDGTVSDGTSKLRMVGFNVKQQMAMNDFLERKEAVELKDCQIQQARRGHSMEVLLKNTTEIIGSPKKISVSSLEFEDSTPATISLQELEGKSIFERVSVNIKVTRKMESEFVATGKKKQDVIVCDSSGTVKVTLWEENIDILEQQASYCLQNFVVREFGSSKYLGMAMQGSRVIPISDIGEVRQADEESGCSEILNAAIIGVSHLGTHKICLRCNARVEPSTSTLGRCTKSGCAMLQRYDICTDQLSAKMLFMASSKIYSLNAYSKVVRDLAEVADDTEVTEEGLMKLPPLSSVTYNDINVIMAFSK